eukprot:CAMPEP_0171070962 /NCGR_PEP_ID=MMETSP0766_2-20121228/10054_1 /TAXON_ID=439317 /ORGANISM="Gambierdiscus australes, Strain CAWD 149" /LENGTH=606 /DNA_ID=CAMNT_0011527485 /DNA_START=8 /DNA_END=1828 /DNA_ORIENTATION=-
MTDRGGLYATRSGHAGSARETPIIIDRDIGSEMRSSRSSPTSRSKDPDQQSFMDSSEMHKSARGSNSSVAMEYVKICENPEDPERTPDIPEDLEHALLTRGKSAHLDGKGLAKSKTYTCACICGVFILLTALAIVLATSPQRSRGVAGYLQDQVRETVISEPQRRRSGAEREAPEEGKSAAPTNVGVEAAAEDETEDSKPRQRERVHPGFLPAFKPSSIFCNVTAPIPVASKRTWELSDSWKRVCEIKNKKDKYPLDRNWCWVGLNQMCHWNLKTHNSWANFQDMASGQGFCPSAAEHRFDPLENPALCDRPEHGAIRNWTREEQDSARRWFKDNVAVYVLSLPGLGDNRWEMISKRLHELKIWATRVPGVDMRVAGALDAAKKEGFVLQDFNFSKAQNTAYEWKHEMGSILGTVGCAAAHFKAQTKVIADGSPMAIIMEDDSWPTEDFIPRLWSLVRQELPCDWEVTALLSRCGYGRCISPRLMRVMPDANEPAWRCHQGSNWGMHAVLYNVARLPRLQRLWKRTVFNEDRPHCMDVDVALASISDKASFYAVPAVQDPGFVKENNHRSARWDINQAASSTTTTTGFYVPTLDPGEPWPGAWKFG